MVYLSRLVFSDSRRVGRTYSKEIDREEGFRCILWCRWELNTSRQNKIIFLVCEVLLRCIQ